MPFATINPATGQTEKEFPAHTPEEVEALVQRAADAFAVYRTTTYAERARHLISTAELLESEVPDLARILTTEMGKTFAAAKAEVSKCAAALRWFAEHCGVPAGGPAGPDGGPTLASSATSRSGRCWPSCRGTSRCGRSSASPRRP